MAHHTNHPNRARPLAPAQLFVAALLAGTAIAACGSSSQPAGTAAPNVTQGIKYADCMRSHGVPDWPDPDAEGRWNIPSSINPFSPASLSAGQACASLQRRSPAPQTPISAAQQRSFIANAKCMRKHGMPNFPDPTSGPGGMRIELGDVSPEETAGIQLANKACADVGTALPIVGSAPGSGSGGPP